MYKRVLMLNITVIVSDEAFDIITFGKSTKKSLDSQLIGMYGNGLKSYVVFFLLYGLFHRESHYALHSICLPVCICLPFMSSK